jgi:RNA polymerase sigma factor (sigma-70 family)
MPGSVGPEQLGWLLDRHAPALELYARQWCHTPEDVVQEALVQLVRQPTAPAHVVAWLYRAVRNGAISAARSARRRQYHEVVAAEMRETWFDAAAGQDMDVEAATAALKTLPIDEREVVVARLWGRLSFEEIGDLVGASSSTAHRRYVAGLSALRERLGVTCPKNPSAKT